MDLFDKALSAFLYLTAVPLGIMIIVGVWAAFFGMLSVIFF